MVGVVTDRSWNRIGALPIGAFQIGAHSKVSAFPVNFDVTIDPVIFRQFSNYL